MKDARRRRPDRNAQRPTGSGARRPKPVKRSSRGEEKTAQCGDTMADFYSFDHCCDWWFLYLAADTVHQMRKADLEQYYELEEENDVAVIVNNNVVRKSDNAAEQQGDTAVSPGKMS